MNVTDPLRSEGSSECNLPTLVIVTYPLRSEEVVNVTDPLRSEGSSECNLPT